VPALPASAWIVIGAATLLRIVVASSIPLGPDEAYYWSWSKHLALGYVDHPPMVAWLIAATAWLGNGPLAVRLPFIACEAVAAIALGYAAIELSGDARAGAAAAIAFTLVPESKFVIGEARPDGPYVCFWALALWFAARASQRLQLESRVMLGAALGGAVLSRFFGWALVFGIAAYASGPQRRELWRHGFWIAFAVAIALCAPNVVWDATHGWQNLAFTLHGRQASFVPDNLNWIATTRFFIEASALLAVGYLVAVRRPLPLIAWTALPFPAFLAVLAFFAPVESYWLLGPFASLCVGIGIAVAGWPARRRQTIGALAAVPAVLTTLAFLFVALPESTEAAFLSHAGSSARVPLSSAAFAYPRLTGDLRALSARGGEAIVTDRLEIAGELYYYGLRPILVGGDSRATMWDGWSDVLPLASLPKRAIIVTFGPLATTKIFPRVAQSYHRIEAGPTLRYVRAETEIAEFSTTRVSQPTSSARLILFAGF
jgi:4-amino-4-deoxy-L-arabinose transferase-like glycosyltransferase